MTHLTAAKETYRFLGPLATEASPLHVIASATAATPGVGLDCSVFVKDESNRLQQKSFKALGGSFSCAKAILRKLADPAANPTGLSTPARSRCRATFAHVQGLVAGHKEGITLATASDGNHGAGLAWAARELGCPCVVWLPKGAQQSRVDMATGLGADVRVTDVSYDDTCLLARRTAAEKGWLLVQDTAWEGYTQVPRDIMDAYSIIPHEALEQMAAAGGAPTHCIVQVGVGSFAAAVVEYVREQLGSSVQCIALEPKGSACLMASLKAGEMTVVGDCPETICVGLDCGVVSDLAWPVLRDELAYTGTIGDGVAADGLRALHTAGIVSGESGAPVAVGFLRALGAAKREALLGITKESRVLVFNTEGLTAPETTARILEEKATQPMELEAEVEVFAVTGNGCAARVWCRMGQWQRMAVVGAVVAGVAAVVGSLRRKN